MKETGELQFFNQIKHQELEAYKNRYQSTLKEWKKYIKGGKEIDPSVVPPDVFNAWNRCRSLGIHPLKIPEKKILTGRSREALLKRNVELLDVSRPFLNNLYLFLKDSGFNVVLFDKEGYLLEILGDHDLADEIRYIGGVVGALWNESSAGHNSIGAILEEKKPVQIVGSQHYIKAYHCETGAGAPIFSPDGTLLGGISLSARNPRFTPHTLGMAVAAAYGVENELLIQQASADRQRAYQFQKSVIGSIMEAIIAVDNNQIISLMNDPAKKLFAIPEADAQDYPLKSLLAPKNAALFELIVHTDRITDKEVRIFSRNAWNDYTISITPILSGGNGNGGKIIVFNEIKRAKSMVTTMVGAHAVYHFDDICGRSPRFQIVMEQARMMAQNDSNVLLLGKSGTGKDIFAQSIHNASQRSSGPYVAINCGAIPRDLLASELFGYEEGAFTGALRGGHQGKFELADGGSIFLDEIAELPLELQSVLLRVIEDKLVTRIGGKRTRKINVRIITATNKNLKQEIEKGNFREDLFYRINVFNIKMIPLCERLDDIPLLVHWFVKKFEYKLKKQISFIDPYIMETLSNYAWPGNVRELQNVIERMMNFADAGKLGPEIIPEEILKTREIPADIAAMESPADTERKMIEKMIELKFQKIRIAEHLNISRATLYRKIKKYGL